MSRDGSYHGLLDQLHTSGCEGQEYSACRPVVVPQGAWEEPTYADHADRGAKIQVIIMAWCGECGAAEWDFV